MRIKLTLVRSDGSQDDVTVTMDASAPIADVAHAIAERDPHSVGAVMPERLTLLRLVPLTQGLPDDWVPLPATAQVSEEWLASGATVALAEDVSRKERGGAPIAELEVLSSRNEGESYPLAPGSWTIGRRSGVDIHLDDPLVSGVHARIEVSDRIEVIDLGSANGVIVDGDFASRVVVADRQELLLGSTRVRIRFIADSPRSTDRSAGGPVSFNRSPRVEPRFAGERYTAPDVPIERDQSPFPWLTMVAPVILAVVLAVVLNRWTMIAMAAMSPVLLVGNFIMGRGAEKRSRRRAITEFDTRIEALARDLEASLVRERTTRLAEAPATTDVVQAIIERTPLLWTRRPEHWNFLNVRVGTGAMPSRSTIDVPRRGSVIPEFQQRLDELAAAHRRVDEAPIVENLFDAGALGCAGEPDLAAPVLHGMLTQIVGLHSPSEVAVAALVSPAWADELAWLKWTPHTSSPQSPLGLRPHLADSPSSATGLLSAIEELIDGRLERRNAQNRGAVSASDAALGRGADVGTADTASGPRSPIPALVVVVSADAPVDRARLVALSERGADAGVFPVWIAHRVADLPATCRTVIDVTAEGSGTVLFIRLGEQIDPAQLDVVPRQTAMALGRALAPVADAGAIVVDASDIPRTIAMTELIGHEFFEQPTAVSGRWRENDSIIDRSQTASTARKRAGKLRAFVGSMGGEPMTLDLRTQGPHALVGGTTGAGKSEFLQVWVLGMAVEYSPDRVTFLFVDYKGGSAFADCVRLPHCVGLVTDLSPHLVRRALTSLRAELHYREHLFNRKKAKDLLDLERRGDPETPPALVIVIDEFAALAKEVPEFVDGVVDIAQRGRSLGIHLIMATQRPAGVIKDNLRANTNLRVALRMADESDAKDVVGTDEAARFDPGLPGRGMAKTGPGRLQEFQSAYAGGWTTREAALAEVAIAELRFGGGAEWQPQAAAPTTPDDADLGPNDQQRLVETIGRAFRAVALPVPRRPWLDELPALVEIAPLFTDDDTVIPFGLSDVPEQQRRVLASFRPDDDGHMAFYGTSGSGKSVALRSMAIATALTPRGGPVHVYGLDFASGGLRQLEALPHVGSIIPGDDTERVQRLLRTLRLELEDREKRYSAVAASTITEYRTHAGRPDEPRILLLIDGFTQFREEWDLAVGRAAWWDVVKNVLASGRQLGIHVVFTADRAGAVPNSVTAVVQRKVVMRLTDEQAYSVLGVPKDVLGDDAAPGRCIADGHETQIGVFGAGETVSTAADQAAAVIAYAEANADRIPVAEPINSLPDQISSRGLPPSIGRRPVLGVSDETLGLTGFEATGTFLLSGPPLSGRSNALAWIVRSLRALDDGHRFVYLGNARSSLGVDPVFDQRATLPEDVAALAREIAADIAAGSEQRYAIAVESIGEFLQTPADAALVELIKQVKRHDQFLVAENEVTGWAGSWPIFAEVKNGRRGLLLQPDAMEGEMLLKTPIPRAARSEFPPGRGMYIEHGKAKRVQLPRLDDEG
ncbi:MAG: FtsK/SpoIIIE domain-containing protein [Microbacteriaceae bacterium]